ncbi:hypothetical protein [Bradyrhizobium genosp. P]|uniref:hypothetical protein n=1 Tax=Bradyrhizobium genosp. P TaxID=83641 RepID=UPI003CE7F3B8
MGGPAALRRSLKRPNSVPGSRQPKADLNRLKAARLRGELVEAAAVEAEWSGILRTVRAGMLAVPSRVAARLLHLSRADVAEIEAEIRAALAEIAGIG